MLTAITGINWGNVMQGSPMVDSHSCKARYVRLTITDTQKNGHMPAVWNIKVWNKAPQLPEINVGTNDAYPGMHRKDVQPEERLAAPISINADEIAGNADKPFDISAIPGFKANKPIRMRVKDGRWAMFFNGTQHLESGRLSAWSMT